MENTNRNLAVTRRLPYGRCTNLDGKSYPAPSKKEKSCCGRLWFRLLVDRELLLLHNEQLTNETLFNEPKLACWKRNRIRICTFTGLSSGNGAFKLHRLSEWNSLPLDNLSGVWRQVIVLERTRKIKGCLLTQVDDGLGKKT